jgi:hypothetical protein
MPNNKTELPCQSRKCTHVVTWHSPNVPPERMAKMGGHLRRGAQRRPRDSHLKGT